MSATSDSSVAGQRFEETAWSVVLAADGSSPGARAALAELCRIYWPAIYSFVRRRGYGPQDAQDLTQSFFLHVVENETVRRASREKGRFRNFLLGALKLCLADAQAHGHTLKRGGSVHFISTDELEAEELHHQQITRDLSPDESLDARWAGIVLDRALDNLRSVFRNDGKSATFEALAPFLEGEKPGISYQDAAERLGVGLGAVKTLIHRLRREFAASLRREIMQTVGAPHEVDDELRQLRAVFSQISNRRAA